MFNFEMIIVTSIVPRTMPGFDFPILFANGFHFLFKLQQMASRWFLLKVQPKLSQIDQMRSQKLGPECQQTRCSQGGGECTQPPPKLVFIWHRSLTLISKAQQEKAFLGPSTQLCKCFTFPNPKQTIQDH